MNRPFQVLTIIGSPNGSKSNTLAFADGFLDDVEAAGVPMERRSIVLGDMNVRPCRGCWNCTLGKPCPLRDDDVKDIKQAMLDCDMLVLGSPVYANQVSAQMKALFDRLFTWCHIFPLLGKYSLSVVTTGNDGHREVGRYLEKMLGTYGTSSFGTVVGVGAFTPGFHPRKETERAKHRKLAARVASTMLAGARPRKTTWQRKMFTVMKQKMAGVRLVHFFANGPEETMPDPPKLMVRMMKSAMRKRNVSIDQTRKLARLMTFELSWWAERDWLSARTFSELASRPLPDGFDIEQRLLG